MKAIILRDFGSVENLISAELPIPSIKEDEVLVKIEALSINPVDVKTRAGKALAGKLKEQNPLILGWDIAGTVVDVGEKALAFKKGDAVFGMVNFPGHGKAYAEYVAVPASHLALKPANISFSAAAAATLAALTAWQAMTQHTQIKKGDRVLIHAAAGGVGHYAVQIAKHLGVYVIGTSSARNRDLVLSLGADEHIDYQVQPFENQVKDIDMVLDTMGGDTIDRSLQIIKRGGALISIPSGMNETVAQKSQAKGVHGATMLVQSNGEDMRAIAQLLETGKMRSHISHTYALDQMASAHLQIETGRTAGKIVIQL